MNRRHCAFATTTLAMTMGIWSAGAFGQSAGSGGATTSAQDAGAAGAASAPAKTPAVAAPVTLSPKAYSDPEAGRAEITNFVNLNVQNLLNDTDTVAQARSRDALTTATLQGGAAASPGFLFEYARALNDAFTRQVDPAKSSIRQRLNVAIVTAKVATVAKNVMLQETAVKLLKDPTEPVVMWALKAAQPLVPQALIARGMGKQAPPLVAAIPDAVFRHPSGPVYYEAYVALSVPDKLTFDELSKLWQSRLAQYQKEVPQDPAADGRPVFALTAADMWKAVVNDDATRTRVMQMVVDQMSAAAQWADKTPAGDERDQLVRLAQQCVGGTYVIGGHQNLAALRRASDVQRELEPRSLPPGKSVKQAVDPVIKQVLADFKGVKQPPDITPGAAPQGATGVASQP